MAISGSAGRSLFVSGISVIVASVSSSTLATEAPFPCGANHLGWVDDAGLDQIDVFLARGIETKIALARQHARNDHAAVHGGIRRVAPAL